MNACRDKIVADWMHAWKWISVQAMAFNAALMATWLVIPDDMKAVLPAPLIKTVAIFACAVGIGGRLYVQNPNKLKPETE